MANFNDQQADRTSPKQLEEELDIRTAKVANLNETQADRMSQCQLKEEKGRRSEDARRRSHSTWQLTAGRAARSLCPIALDVCRAQHASDHTGGWIRDRAWEARSQ